MEWLSESIKCHNDESTCRFRFWAAMYADASMLYSENSLPVCSLARVYQIRDWMIGQHYENNIKMQMFEAFQVSALCPVSISSYELQIFSVSRNINGLLMTEFKKWRAPKAAGRTAAPRRDRAPKTTWRPWGTWTTTRGRSSATARSICWEPPSRPRAWCRWCPHRGAGQEQT